MSAHSPRPISQRIFSVLLVVLLVGSLGAPIAAQPAAAQESTTEQVCSSPARFFQTANYACTTVEMLGSVDETESGSYLQSDIHANARGVEESWRSTYVLTGNYLQDTPAIASLEGKDAIASSWENNETRSEATTAVNDSIDDYFSRLEVQILEETSAHQSQMAYLAEQAKSDPETSDGFLHTAPPNLDGNSATVQSTAVNGNLEPQQYELQNGSVHEYQMAELNVTTDDGTTYTGAVRLDRYDETNDEFTMTLYYASGNDWGDWPTNGYYMVDNVPDFDLESGKVYENREVSERLLEIEKQAQTAHENFDPAFIDDMYTALDNEEIAPEDLRGAEGMVRYLSGDSNVTDERYKLATHAVLDLDRPNLNMTMTVQYDGATDFEMIEENGTRVRNYTDYVNRNYDGLLFSGETPTDGLETGQTYSTSELNGSQLIVTENETVHFYDGEFTIESMRDSDGEEVNSTDWEPGPNYDTYSSDEYVALLETISEQQQQIAEQEGDSDGFFGGLPNPFDGLGGGSTLVGLAIIGVVILLVVGFVTDMIPGMN